MNSDKRTRVYVALRTAQGHSTCEIMRVVTPYVTRELSVSSSIDSPNT